MKKINKTEKERESRMAQAIEAPRVPTSSNMAGQKIFTFGTPENFCLLVDGGQLGVQNGRTFQVGGFKEIATENAWLQWQLFFQRHYLERLEQYAQLRFVELASADREPAQDDLR